MSKSSKSEFPDVWRWLQSLSPIERVEALSLNNIVASTVIINLVYYERKEVWNQLKIWDAESFKLFKAEVEKNVMTYSKQNGNGKTKKRSRTTTKGYKPQARSQFFYMKISTCSDPKVLARNITSQRSNTDSHRDALIRNRKKCVNSLCVMRSNNMIGEPRAGMFKTSQSNYVDTISVSYESVHNDNMAKLWSQLKTYSDGNFLLSSVLHNDQNNELKNLPRDEWCAEW